MPLARISRPLVCLFGMLLFAAGCRGVPDGTPDQLLRRGNELMAEKRHKDARRHYDAIVKRYPSAPELEEAMLRIAEARRFRREGSSSFEAYKRFVERYPTSRLGLEAAQGEYELGVEYLGGKMGGFFLFGKDESRGVLVLEHMQTHFPNYSLADDALLHVGDWQLKQRDYADAAKTYRRLLGEYPRSVYQLKVRFQLARAIWLRSEGADYDERILFEAKRAFASFEAAAKRVPDGGTLYTDQIAHAQKRVQDVHERLAEKQLIIARFYDRRSASESALIYYRYCAQKYADTKGGKQAAAILVERAQAAQNAAQDDGDKKEGA